MRILGSHRKSQRKPDILDAVASPQVGMPMHKRLDALEAVYNGLVGHPDFIRMMEAVKDNPSDQISQLDAQVAAIEDSIRDMRAYTHGDKGRQRLGDAVQINRQLQATVCDLRLAYKIAQQSYREVFANEVAREGFVSPFDMEQAVNLKIAANSGDVALRYGKHDPVHSPSDNDIAAAMSPVIHARRTPMHRIMTGASPYTRAIEDYLAFNMIVDSSAYQAMMVKDAQHYVDNGMITPDDIKYHNVNVRALEDAGEWIRPYVVDEYGERVTQDQTGVLSSNAKAAAELIAEQLPHFVNFLNDLHAKIYPDEPNKKPFDIEQSKAIARVMSAQRLQAEVQGSDRSSAFTIQ